MHSVYNCTLISYYSQLIRNLIFTTVATKAMQFHPTPEVPALQYVGSVEENGAASEAGLSAGDFIIEVQIKGLAHIYIHLQRKCWPGLNCISPGGKSNV